MYTIFTNSGSSKISGPMCEMLCCINDMLHYQILRTIYAWKNIGMSYRMNNFKVSAQDNISPKKTLDFCRLSLLTILLWTNTF